MSNFGEREKGGWTVHAYARLIGEISALPSRHLPTEAPVVGFARCSLSLSLAKMGDYWQSVNIGESDAQRSLRISSFKKVGRAKA